MATLPPPPPPSPPPPPAAAATALVGAANQNAEGLAFVIAVNLAKVGSLDK